MRKLTIAAVSALTLGFAGCTSTQQGAAIGGLGGAAIGAAVADDDLEGALVGGAIGAVAGGVAGNVIGRSNGGDCVYRDRAGRRYVADCPAGY